MNGPCVVTNQGVFVEWQATYKHYPNEELFTGMDSQKSYTAWGSAQKGLFDDRAWTSDLLRKVCIQLWQPMHSVDHRVVDTAGGEKNWGAPFFCRKDLIFPAIFGDTRPEKGTGEGTEGSIVFHMEDLQSDRAARAIDACKAQSTTAMVNSTIKVPPVVKPSGLLANSTSKGPPVVKSGFAENSDIKAQPPAIESSILANSKSKAQHVAISGAVAKLESKAQHSAKVSRTIVNSTSKAQPMTKLRGVHSVIYSTSKAHPVTMASRVALNSMSKSQTVTKAQLSQTKRHSSQT